MWRTKVSGRKKKKLGLLERRKKKLLERKGVWKLLFILRRVRKL